jgi:NADPH2:quinone reductase
MANPVTATLAKLAAAAGAGIIHVPVTRTYDLEEVPEGLADFAAGTLGKLAVRIHD